MQLSTLHLILNMCSRNSSKILPGQAGDFGHTSGSPTVAPLMVLATPAEAQESPEAVLSESNQMETGRIDARSQVVLHFDFMSESTTQVFSADHSIGQLVF